MQSFLPLCELMRLLEADREELESSSASDEAEWPPLTEQSQEQSSHQLRKTSESASISVPLGKDRFLWKHIQKTATTPSLLLSSAKTLSLQIKIF